MSDKADKMTRRLRQLAREDHEQSCRNEPEWPHLSIQHRHVHDINALRKHRRENQP